MAPLADHGLVVLPIRGQGIGALLSWARVTVTRAPPARAAPSN